MKLKAAVVFNVTVVLLTMPNIIFHVCLFDLFYIVLPYLKTCVWGGLCELYAVCGFMTCELYGAYVRYVLCEVCNMCGVWVCIVCGM